MGKLINLYELKKRKITEKYSKEGELGHEGIAELYRLSKHYGKSKEEYFPSDYGTKQWHERE